MELFNEVKNRYFQLVFKIINECANGKAKDEILKIIDDGEFEQKVIGKNNQTFEDIVLNKCKKDENLGLLIEKEGAFYPSFEGTKELPLPVRFTVIEKAWLKALLKKDGVRMILSNETFEKLQKELEDFDTPIRDEYFEMTNKIELPEISDREVYHKNFKIIMDALLKEKPIRYNNTDKNGNLYSNKLAVPVSIEYSMRDGRFRVSMYSIDDKRPIMANIFTLSDVKIVDEDVEIDRQTAKNILFEQKYSEEPIVLEVIDKKNAMERCFMCFSGMERSARQINKDKYEIQLYYYLFDEENLIRNIISLGPYVKVISPQRVVDEIVRRVKKSIKMYE
ncbi:UNVERIFIED_CONTAM: WYL domain-containing protein [Acetivibrio alkalicellulosi]